jgi:hypothetical protein
MIALASLPPWNDLGSHAGVRPDYRNGGRAGVSAQEASGPATRQRCASSACTRGANGRVDAEASGQLCCAAGSAKEKPR